ncbi:MAG: hypothetical protein QMC77_08540 [Methanocellales archaeon]|nr:hypothetical protein [Methanocellales archaeon]
MKEISDRLKGIPIDEIQNLEILRNNFEDEIRECIADRARKELQVSAIEDRKADKEKNFEKEIKKDKKQKELRLKLELCDRSVEALKGIKEKVVGELRENAEQKFEEYFLSLHWKKGDFKNVKISDDYKTSVINNLGSECLGTMSAGERQVLALSFMASLSNVSGFDAPIIIDTPLGRISGVPREKIAASLPRYLENSQLILLMTDQEYTPTVKSNMKERIGKEFELRYDEEEVTTKIVEIEGV